MQGCLRSKAPEKAGRIDQAGTAHRESPVAPLGSADHAGSVPPCLPSPTGFAPVRSTVALFPTTFKRSRTTQRVSRSPASLCRGGALFGPLHATSLGGPFREWVLPSGGSVFDNEGWRQLPSTTRPLAKLEVRGELAAARLVLRGTLNVR